MGNIDMAIVYYQSALRLKPYFTDAYNNMASALVQKGLIPEAMDCYMQVGVWVWVWGVCLGSVAWASQRAPRSNSSSTQQQQLAAAAGSSTQQQQLAGPSSGRSRIQQGASLLTWSWLAAAACVLTAGAAGEPCVGGRAQ